MRPDLTVLDAFLEEGEEVRDIVAGDHFQVFDEEALVSLLTPSSTDTGGTACPPTTSPRSVRYISPKNFL